MRNILLIKLLCCISIGVGLSAVHLDIQNIDLDAGTLEIYMDNDVPVRGFQFSLVNINILSVYGGAAAASGFMITSSTTNVLAFSLFGSYVLGLLVV